MRVTALCPGMLGMYMGEHSISFDVEEGSTASELLARLGAERGSCLPRGIWDPGNGHFHKSIRLLGRGRHTLAPGDLLSDGDEVIVIFPLAGG